MNARWLLMISVLSACMVTGCGLSPTRSGAGGRQRPALRASASAGQQAVFTQTTTARAPVVRAKIRHKRRKLLILGFIFEWLKALLE